MERSHIASSGSTHQDGSWTCQRCGWVYPNAHPSAKHRRNHKKQCGKIKGFELQSEHKGGSSDEVSSDDENHGKKDGAVPAVEHPSGLQSRDLPAIEVNVSEKVKLDTLIPAVEHPSGLQSRDLPVTEVDVSDKVKLDTSIPAVEHPSASQSRDLSVTDIDVSDTVKLDTPILQGISASLDVKPEVPAHGSTQNIIKGDVVKSEFPAPEHSPSAVSLDNAFGEGKVMHATLVDTVEVPTLVLPQSETEFVEQDAKFEDAPIERTREMPLKTPEVHAKLGHASKVDGVDAAAHDSPGLDFELANIAQNKDAKSEGSGPEPTQSIASLDEPSRTLQEQSKVSLTPCVDEVEIAAQVSGGFDSGLVRESHKKESSSILKKEGANGRGSSHSSKEDDSWTCNRCGWVYPNSHPSAKHRRNHKKQCGKIKGFELRTEPHEGGSSDEVSSDGEIGVKKEHLPHQSPQILDAQDQAKNPAATGSIPPGVDNLAIFGEERISTESGSSNRQSRDLSASKGHAPDRELLDTSNSKDISTPDVKSSDVVPELPQNMASLAQQNLSEGENQKGAAVLDQITVVLCGPDTSETKELPKHSSLEEEMLSNPAIVQENLGSPETQLNAVLSLPKSVHASASEGLDDQVKDTLVERGSTNMLAETPDGLSGDFTPKVASIPSVPDERVSTNMLAETPDGLSGDCTLKVVSRPSVPDDPGSTNMLAETPETPNGFSGDCTPKVASIPSVPNDCGSTNMLAEAPDELSGDCTPKVASIPSVSDDRGSTKMLAETSDGLSGDSTPKVASIPSVLDSLPFSSSPAYFENKGASILKLDEPSLAVTAMDFGASDLSNETLDASTGAGLNQSVVITERTDVSEKPGLGASSNFKSLDAMDYLMVHDPLRKETAETMTGGLEGSDGLLALDKISSDLSLPTLTAENVLVENMAVRENLLPPTDSSTADIFGSANDSEEDGRFLSAQTSLNSVELRTQNESMSEIVVRGNDDACSTGIDKADEPTHSLERQGTPVGVAEVDVSKEVTTAADTTQEATSIQQRLDIPGYVASKNIFSDSADFGEGVALVSAEGITEITNTGSSIVKDSYMSDHQVETTEGVEKPEAKEDEPCETRGIGSTDLSYVESEAGGGSSMIDCHQVKIAETRGAPEGVEKPGGKEDTPCETGGIGSSDMSYTETNSVTSSETGVAGCAVLGASAHKLSDSLEIYEDAADSLESCSVGGSVEENECLDEPRQVSEGVPEEPKHLGVASLDKRVIGGSVGIDEEPSILNGSSTGEAVPGESVGLDKPPSILSGATAGEAVPGKSVGLDKEPSILNGSSAVEAVPGESVGLDKKTSILNGLTAGEPSSEEKITSLPGASYAVRSKVEDLKAPSPEAWQESAGPSHTKSEGKRKISSTSEVTEDGRSGESHTALRSLMAKEGPEKVDQIVESVTSAGDLKSLNKTAGSLASGNGTKPKSRSFWSQCICCPTVH